MKIRSMDNVNGTPHFPGSPSKEDQNNEDFHPTRRYKEADECIRHFSTNKIKKKFEILQLDLIKHMENQLTEMMSEVMQEVEDTEISQRNINQMFGDTNKYNNRIKSSKGTLADKIFLPRESLLTDLFQIKHFCTIYNIFMAILIILFLNTAVYDLVVNGEFNLGISLIQWNFGNFHIVVLMWILMMMGTLAVFSCFHYWAHQRNILIGKLIYKTAWDYGWLCAFIVYQISFSFYPIFKKFQYDLPPASSLTLLMEQTRILMKVHAFVRSNVPRVLEYKPHSEQDTVLSPDFGHFLYFMFAPTMVYRDTYPRTHRIRWRFVLWHLLEVIGTIFYMSFIVERFLMPMYNKFGIEPFTPERFVVITFSSMMPATLIFLCCFFGFLHSWMNAFAEMLRFADRMFYKDWWNANSYAEYFRLWNLVVHDWLYTYIFKDSCKFFKSKSRLGPTLTVFLVSAIVHEYILIGAFCFFYPMLFLAFGGFSALFVFLTRNSSKGGNLFMWLTLCIGNGTLYTLYSIEWYARINCPRIIDTFWDFVIPRSWYCNAPHAQ